MLPSWEPQGRHTSEMCLYAVDVCYRIGWSTNKHGTKCMLFMAYMVCRNNGLEPSALYRGRQPPSQPCWGEWLKFPTQVGGSAQHREAQHREAPQQHFTSEDVKFVFFFLLVFCFPLINDNLLIIPMHYSMYYFLIRLLY